MTCPAAPGPRSARLDPNRAAHHPCPLMSAATETAPATPAPHDAGHHDHDDAAAAALAVTETAAAKIREIREAEAIYRRVFEVSEELVRDLPDRHEYPSNLAWYLANCPIPELRNPARAVELGRKAVELSPNGN